MPAMTPSSSSSLSLTRSLRVSFSSCCVGCLLLLLPRLFSSHQHVRVLASELGASSPGRWGRNWAVVLHKEGVGWTRIPPLSGNCEVVLIGSQGAFHPTSSSPLPASFLFLLLLLLYISYVGRGDLIPMLIRNQVGGKGRGEDNNIVNIVRLFFYFFSFSLSLSCPSPPFLSRQTVFMCKPCFSRFWGIFFFFVCLSICLEFNMPTKKKKKKVLIEVRLGEIYELFCCRVLLEHTIQCSPIPSVKALSLVDISSFWFTSMCASK